MVFAASLLDFQKSPQSDQELSAPGRIYYGAGPLATSWSAASLKEVDLKDWKMQFCCCSGWGHGISYLKPHSRVFGMNARPTVGMGTLLTPRKTGIVGWREGLFTSQSRGPVHFSSLLWFANERKVTIYFWYLTERKQKHAPRQQTIDPIRLNWFLKLAQFNL